MPPQTLPPIDPRDPSRQGRAEAGHLLPPHQPQKGPVGPIIGAVIIVILLVIGALYFWGAHLNSQKAAENIPPVLEEDLTIAS